MRSFFHFLAGGRGRRKKGFHGIPGPWVIRDKNRAVLDPIGKDGEADQDTDAAVQVPDSCIVFEHFCTQKDGETHHSPNKGVEPCKRREIVHLSKVDISVYTIKSIDYSCT